MYVKQVSFRTQQELRSAFDGTHARVDGLSHLTTAVIDFACCLRNAESSRPTQIRHLPVLSSNLEVAIMSLQKLLDPFMKPAARFYKARVSRELNKMGKLWARQRALALEKNIAPTVVTSFR